MTLRTTSVQRQRLARRILVILGVVAYFVLVLAFGLGNPFRFFGPHQMRVLLPLVVIIRILVRECRWDGVTRDVKGESEEGEGAEGPGQEDPKDEADGDELDGEMLRVEGEGRDMATCAAEPLAGGQETDSPLSGRSNEMDDRHSSTSTLNIDSTQPATNAYTFASSIPSDATGEELFERACVMPHQVIPDFIADGPYLELLGRSAAKGYAPAFVKLGECAMRRAAWVEAYYWMFLAKRRGTKNLSAVMRGIRRNWSQSGFPDEEWNVNPLFSVEAGSIGRALLDLDSGHEAAKARRFLKSSYPDLLAEPI